MALAPGTYARLLASDDPAAELAELLVADAGPEGAAVPVVVGRTQDTRVLEEHAEVHVESLRTLMARFPAETSNEYETYIRSVIAQCAKAEMLAASSWRLAATTDSESAGRLMAHLKDLEAIRADLLARLPGSIGARLDRACNASGLPESVVVTLLGVGAEQMWDMRTRGVIPPGALPGYTPLSMPTCD